MRAVDELGRTWRVRRRWLPWRRRIREVPDTGWGDVGMPDGDDPVSVVIGLVLLIVVVVLALPALLILAGLVLELALLLALLPAVVLARVVFGQPWVVQVRGPGRRFLVAGPVVHDEQVRGWQASGRRIAELAGEARAIDTATDRTDR